MTSVDRRRRRAGRLAAAPASRHGPRTPPPRPPVLPPSPPRTRRAIRHEPRPPSPGRRRQPTRPHAGVVNLQPHIFLPGCGHPRIAVALADPPLTRSAFTFTSCGLVLHMDREENQGRALKLGPRRWAEIQQGLERDEGPAVAALCTHPGSDRPGARAPPGTWSVQCAPGSSARAVSSAEPSGLPLPRGPGSCPAGRVQDDRQIGAIMTVIQTIAGLRGPVRALGSAA